MSRLKGKRIRGWSASRSSLINRRPINGSGVISDPARRLLELAIRRLSSDPSIYDAQSGPVSLPLSGTGKSGSSIEARFVAAIRSISDAVGPGQTIADIHNAMISNSPRVVGRRSGAAMTPAADWIAANPGLSVLDNLVVFPVRIDWVLIVAVGFAAFYWWVAIAEVWRILAG